MIIGYGIGIGFVRQRASDNSLDVEATIQTDWSGSGTLTVEPAQAMFAQSNLTFTLAASAQLGGVDAQGDAVIAINEGLDGKVKTLLWGSFDRADRDDLLANCVEDSGNAEVGRQASQWTDLSKTGGAYNNNHATQSTDDDQPTGSTNGAGDFVLSFDKDDASGTAGDRMALPFAWLSGAAACWFLFAVRCNAGTNPAQALVDYDSGDFSIQFNPGAFRVAIGATRKDWSWTANANMHLWLVQYDGSQGTDADRLSAERDQVSLGAGTATGTLPATLPALTTTGRLGSLGGGTAPFDGDFGLLAAGIGVLTPEEKTALYTQAAILLNYL